jgi:hypothetical protein
MGSYEQSPEPKYLVEFEGSAHFAWTDLGWTAHDRIVAYSLAFMEHYAKAKRPATCSRGSFPASPRLVIDRSSEPKAPRRNDTGTCCDRSQCL